MEVWLSRRGTKSQRQEEKAGKEDGLDWNRVEKHVGVKSQEF